MIVASDGIITAACPIPDSITICAHTKMLLNAVEQCTDDISLTQQDDCLLVKSGDFEARVPGLPLTDVPQVFADTPRLPVSRALVWAMETAGAIADAKSSKLAFSTVQLALGSATATNGSVIVQAWHGDPNPELNSLVLPAAFIAALAKRTSDPYKIGLSLESLTIWFESGAWIKTQLYPADSKLPNLNSILNIPYNQQELSPLPTNLYYAVDKLKKAKSTKIAFLNNCGVGENGVSIVDNVVGGIEHMEFEIKDLLAIKHIAELFSWMPGFLPIGNPNEPISLFFGNNVRGAIMHTWRGLNVLVRR
jgi:hypothetical protein